MEKLRILICEDDPKEQEAICALLAASTYPTQFSTYSTGEALLKAYYPGCCDLVLMDIFMSGISGVETVSHIRAKDPYVPIAFLTSSPDFTMQGYQNRVDRYLLKPVNPADLEEALYLAKRNQSHQETITLSIQGKEKAVPISSISYAEQDGHAILVHQEGGEILRVIMKLSTLSEMLPSPPFCQSHKSFLANLTHVRYLDTELSAFLMNDGGYAYIRRGSLRAARDAYSHFMFDQIRKEGEG